MIVFERTRSFAQAAARRMLAGIGKQKIGFLSISFGYYLIGLPLGLYLWWGTSLGLAGEMTGMTATMLMVTDRALLLMFTARMTMMTMRVYTFRSLVCFNAGFDPCYNAQPRLHSLLGKLGHSSHRGLFVCTKHALTVIDLNPVCEN